MTLITLKKVCKIYNRNTNLEVDALKNVSLDIKRGDFIAITGPSGSGKSTLLNIISGIEAMTSGEYYFEGINMAEAGNAKISKIRNRKIGFVLQDFGLLGNESVLQNVRLPLIIGGVNGKKSKESAYAALEKVGILSLANKKTNQLSGGQRQRVAIARALSSGCELILADEPTGALDKKTAKEIAEIFRRVNAGGTTVVIVTHNPELAAVCNKKYKIVDGEIFLERGNDAYREYKF